MLNPKRGIAVSAIALLSTQFALGTVFAQESADNDVEAQDTTNLELDSVVVVGTRKSLSDALDLKRESVGVLDAIVASDIVAFPDLNVSESLQRIPGVTISRSQNGEGANISVRGLAPEFTRTTLNGITAASGAAGREFEFDIFASELFSQVTVAKTPTADMTDGGLAATVDLRTPRPFDFSDRQFAVALSGQYAELGGFEDGLEQVDPRASFLFSNTFDNDRLGVLVSGSYSETTVRADLSQTIFARPLGGGGSIGFDPTSSAGLVVNGTNVTDPTELQNLADTLLIGSVPRVGTDLIPRERLGLTAALQYKATDNLDLGLDVLYADFDEEAFRPTFRADPNGSINEITTDGDRIVTARFDEVPWRVRPLLAPEQNEFLHVTLDGVWQLGEDLNLYAQFGHSEATQDQDIRVYSYRFDAPLTLDNSVVEYPQFSTVGVDAADAASYRPEFILRRLDEKEDQESSFKIDLTKSFDGPVLSSLQAGAQVRDHTKSFTRFQGLNTDIPELSEVDTPLGISGFLSDAPAGTPTEFPVVDNNFIRDDANMPPLDIINGSTYEIQEEIAAVYAKANLDFEVASKPVAVDLGVRYVETDLTSQGFVLGLGDPLPITVERSYSDVLPSFTARMDLSDEFVLRASANKSITRPTVSQLSPGVTLITIGLSGNGGNPLLDPYRANQYDLSLEWYFADEALLSVTAFHKDIESFVALTSQTEFVFGENREITRPSNGDDGSISGIEISYQQPFTFLPAPFDGFGTLLNLTSAESEATRSVNGEDIRGNLPGQSDLSYNAIIYYETEKFGARLAYSHRSEYLERFEAGFDRFVDERSQLDFSARYTLNDNVDLSFDAININGEDAYTYHRDEGFNFIHYDQGAVYSLGFRLKL